MLLDTNTDCRTLGATALPVIEVERREDGVIDLLRATTKRVKPLDPRGVASLLHVCYELIDVRPRPAVADTFAVGVRDSNFAARSECACKLTDLIMAALVAQQRQRCDAPPLRIRWEASSPLVHLFEVCRMVNLDHDVRTSGMLVAPNVEDHLWAARDVLTVAEPVAMVVGKDSRPLPVGDCARLYRAERRVRRSDGVMQVRLGELAKTVAGSVGHPKLQTLRLDTARCHYQPADGGFDNVKERAQPARGCRREPHTPSNARHSRMFARVGNDSGR